MSWQDKDPDRLEAELRLMHSRTKAKLHRDGEHIFWVEEIRSATGQPFQIIVDYPELFPSEIPRAFISSPSVTGAPHRFGDGSLCLFDDPHASNPKITALVVRNRTVAWILAYEIWCVTHEWLAPQH